MRICILLLLCFVQVRAQKITLSGKIVDNESGEALKGVIVLDTLSGNVTETNTFGFFSLVMSNKPSVVRLSYVGYKAQYLKVAENGSVEVRMERTTELEQIIVRKDRDWVPAGNPLSLSLAEVRNMPMLLGEADVLKSLSFFSGVSTGNEGGAGLYVRGGTPDQNLILLDGVPVYNAMHLGGFFSVFNPVSLKSVDLYKGSFPARYGGRLSSIVDLTMKEGNNKKFGGEVGVGLLNQSLTLEGPIVKNKASFILSGRMSTLGLVTPLLTRKRLVNSSGDDYVYRFHDFNAKVNYQISKTDHVYLSFYNGFDRFKYEDWSRTEKKEISSAVGNNWGNNTGTVRYSKIISPKIFSKAILIYSDYISQFTNRFRDGDEVFFRHSDTKVTDLGAKIQVDYYPNRFLEIRGGLDFTKHNFKPFNMTSNFAIANANETKVDANQQDVYVDSDFKITKRFTLNAGLRHTTYRVDEKTFNNTEPRLGFNWKFVDSWRLFGRATVMNQYVHLLVNNGYGFGYDAWVPATSLIPPSRATQWSAGITKKLSKSDIDISFEVYQKKLSNLIDYPEGVNFSSMFADSWESIVKTGGSGRSKGLEVMVARNTGKVRGRISYTLSKSELRFDEINSGNWYPLRYDRRHNLSLSTEYEISRKWSLNSTFIYQTGHAITLPVGALMNGNTPSFIYLDRNKGRMPDFHKMDLGVARSGVIWNRYKTKLSFGLYNVYNRANPLFIDFKRSTNQETKVQSISVKQYSMFPVLPYINYSITF